MIAAEIFGDYNINGLQGGDENLLHKDPEVGAVDGTVKQPGHIEAFPSAVVGLGNQPLALECLSLKRCHVGPGPRLVDKHQTLRDDIAAVLHPLRSPACQTGALTLAGDSGSFLKLSLF